MHVGLLFSITFHVAVLALAVFGLPQLARVHPVENRLVVVDVVTVAEVTNAPPPAEVAKPDNTPPPPPVAAAKPDRTPPPPPPQASAATPPPPPPPPTAKAPTPAPAPAPEKVAEAPKPVPAPAPEKAVEAEAVPVPVKRAEPEKAKPEKPEPVPAPAEKPEPPKPEKVAEVPPPEAAKPDRNEPEAAKVEHVEPEPPAPIPVRRPTPPKRVEQVAANEAPPTPEEKPKKTDDFLNVLKTVQNLKSEAPKRTSETPPAPAPKADTTARQSNFDPNQKLSVSEMDAVRRQISGCWLMPAGAKDAGDLIVAIEVTMNQDRTVRYAKVVDQRRMMTDPFYRSAAESALRALKSPACSPLQLPPEKYDTWKSFTITFDPKDALS